MESLPDRRDVPRGGARHLPRWSKWLLAGLCLVTLVYGTGNLQQTPAQYDALQNLAMGVQMGGGGGGLKAGYGREPLVPAVIAMIVFAQRELGFGQISPACVDRRSGQVETPACRAAYAPYKTLNVLFAVVAGIGVFFLTRWFVGSEWLPHAAFLLVSQSLLGVPNIDAFMSEVPAAAVLVVVSCLWVRVTVRRRTLDSALLGLALAALVLTKIVFLPFAFVVAAGLAVADWVKRIFGKRTVLLVGLMLVFFSVPVGGWMMRNGVLFGDFAVVESGGDRAWQVIGRRAAYNTMRDDEFAAGFWFYSPWQPALGIPESSYERFETKNIDGFRYAVVRRALRGEALANKNLTAAVLAAPWQHLRVSVLMAWRGVFVQDRLGIAAWSESNANLLLRSFRLPKELSRSLPEAVLWHAHKPWEGKEASRL